MLLCLFFICNKTFTALLPNDPPARVMIWEKVKAWGAPSSSNCRAHDLRLNIYSLVFCLPPKIMSRNLAHSLGSTNGDGCHTTLSDDRETLLYGAVHYDLPHSSELCWVISGYLVESCMGWGCPLDPAWPWCLPSELRPGWLCCSRCSSSSSGPGHAQRWCCRDSGPSIRR